MPSRVFTHVVRVIYAHTDQMGVVYYGRYFEFIEAARNELLRECGFAYKALEALGITLPVVSAHLDYFAPARYDDEIEIHTRIEKLENVRVTLAYDAFEKVSRQKLFSGYTIHAFVGKSGKPTRPPKEFLEKVSER
ncbi:MAG: acyl-CoA thioesterase [Chloroherpetonaceae bacterium]|nr:acyl-CoA thioesterase [Chloroherpetonaceae bacterium]MDW8436728.1 thioesterase family protein [Chloroherpetonaceae bacterium]